jgi:hypothetical protein
MCDICVTVQGPVKGAMLIEDVRACTVMVAAHQIRIHGAVESDFYLHSRRSESHGLHFSQIVSRGVKMAAVGVSIATSLQ